MRPRAPSCTSRIDDAATARATTSRPSSMFLRRVDGFVTGTRSSGRVSVVVAPASTIRALPRVRDDPARIGEAVGADRAVELLERVARELLPADVRLLDDVAELDRSHRTLHALVDGDVIAVEADV